MKLLINVQPVQNIGIKLKPNNKNKRNFYWSNEAVVKHRASKISNAIDRRDVDYMKQRQLKLSQVLPISLFSQAKIEFLKEPLSDATNTIGLSREEDTLKTNQNKEKHED